MIDNKDLRVCLKIAKAIERMGAALYEISSRHTCDEGVGRIFQEFRDFGWTLKTPTHGRYDAIEAAEDLLTPSRYNPTARFDEPRFIPGLKSRRIDP